MSRILNSIKSRYEALRIFLIQSPFLTAILFITSSWFVIAAIVWHFEDPVKDHNINSYQDAVWWGIVTLLTVGYGDKYPISPEGRFFAGLLMVSGVVGIAIVTAKISSFFLERALRERRGYVDSNTLKDHFIVCGWKDEMASLLLHIIDSGTKVDAEKLLLLNAVGDAEIESVLLNPRLKKVKVIKGEFYNELVMKQAAPERAAKVLILADATPDPDGKIPTITEADARTIMTAMTLNNIAKGTPVVAEILDASMDQYLKLAHVHEIIYSRNYSRLLLANASTGIGLTSVFQDLLDPGGSVFLATKKIDEKFIETKYADFRTYFESNEPNSTLIGILENSGNSHRAKESAIRRAQQTPNMKQLLDNLQAVKSLRFNKPVFSPDLDYVIRDGSMAIVIEHRQEGQAHV